MDKMLIALPRIEVLTLGSQLALGVKIEEENVGLKTQICLKRPRIDMLPCPLAMNWFLTYQFLSFPLPTRHVQGSCECGETMRFLENCLISEKEGTFSES